MKVVLSFFAVALFSISSSFAQESKSHFFDVRGYGGMSILQLTSDENTSLIEDVLHRRSVTGRPGYQYGLAVTFGNRFFVQPGFQISSASTKVVNENTVTGTELTDETTINMISVPLKVGLRIINPEDENLINIRIFGGIDGQHVTSVSHSLKSEEIDNITKDDYNSLIINADLGMGLDLWIFYLDLGYQLGLTPFYSGGDKAKGNSFYGNLGLRFSFGG